MRDILRAAGGDLEDLVDVTVFLTDMSLYQDFNSVYNEYFSSAETGPSRTTVGVQSLPGPHLVIEIKGIAHLGK
jgi:2-aminomuconate deaminase